MDGDDDNDGENDDEDSDDDNDGKNDDEDSDDDNDCLGDDFDSQGAHEVWQSSNGSLDGGSSTDSPLTADANALLLIGLVEAPEAHLLTVEIYDPAGSLVASSVPAPGRALATVSGLTPGTYTVRVRNNSAGPISYNRSLIKRSPWL